MRMTGEGNIALDQHPSTQPLFIHKLNSDVKPGVAIEISKKIRPSLRQWFFSSKKTKRKDARNGDDEKLYLLDDMARQRIVDVDLHHVVEIPLDIDLNEWLATHTIQFFEHINYLYGAISDYCSCDKCALMTGPNDVVYQWLDDKGKKVKVTAAQYIEYVTSYTQKTICDESVFPTKYGNVFPASFETVIKKIYRLLLHVLAHIYHAHFKQVVDFNLHAFINSVTLHFLVFSKRYNLLEAKESDVLDDLYHKLTTLHASIAKDDSSKSSSISTSSSTDRDWRSGAAAATSADNTSQTSLSPTHESSSPSRHADPLCSSPKKSGDAINFASVKGGGGEGAVKSSSGVAMTRLAPEVMDENKENLLQLSSSPVLTQQPNGHPRTPST